MKHQKIGHAESGIPFSNSGQEDQVAALVLKLKEAHSRRPKEGDLQSASKEAVVQLGREVLGDQSGDMAAVYQRCALKIDHLISTSSAMRMVGYYLRGALAARLKRSHKSKYVRSARSLLGIKSSADITACPAFYTFVQQHSSGIASAGQSMDIDAWLQEPLFLADIGWSEWRWYLGKSHRWIIESALEQFQASLQPAQDWMQRGWIEEYEDDRMGRGVRAVRDVPLSENPVAADLRLFAQEMQVHQESAVTSAAWYRIEWDGGKQVLDAEQLWMGKINHLPMPHCNLRLTAAGKLVQTRAIAAGEALTFDYGVQWWVHRVTGVPWNEWMTNGATTHRKGCADLFYRMHESVSDYTALLATGWDERFRTAASEVEREMAMLELWEVVSPGEEREREEGEVAD
jgi:hypothetical protein